jgi:uncharacterized protein YndB with AHSA1/START domain
MRTSTSSSHEEDVMQTTLNEITSSTRIDAPIGTVWEAITTPSQIKKWFFGVDTESDWKVGSQLVHTGEYQGKPYVDKGVILEIEPPRRLVHTHWSEVSGRPDDAEHHEVVTWELAEIDGGTELTIRERNLPSEEAAATSEEAWKGALASLKKLLER